MPDTLDRATSIEQCRSEVIDLAISMENKLRKNDHKLPWQECNVNYFLIRLREELDELEDAYRRWLLKAFDTPKDISDLDKITEARMCIKDEAVDVANFAMMIHATLTDDDYPNNPLQKYREADYRFKAKRTAGVVTDTNSRDLVIELTDSRVQPVHDYDGK